MLKLFIITIIISCIFSSSLIAQTWSSVGSGINISPYSLENYNNELYAGGLATGLICLYKWDNNYWNVMSPWQSNINYLRIEVLKTYNNELYASGYFDSVDSVSCTNIVRWDGMNWNALGAGLDNTAYSMCEYNGELFVAGQFDFAGNDTSRFIARWNGSNWSRVGSGTSFGHGLGIFATCVYNNELYVAGDFISVDSTSMFFIARWNGSAWSGVGAGLGFNTDVYAMAVYKGELYVGGEFTDILNTASCSHLAKWDGTNWSCVGGGVKGISVKALTVYNGDLYVAGRFDSVGNIRTNNIARWDGSQWHALGTGLSNFAYSLDTFQNGLYVGCACAYAGGVPIQLIARWDMPVSVNEISNSQIDIQTYIDPSNSFLIIDYNESLIDVDVQIVDELGQIKYSKYHNKIFNGQQERIDKFLLGKFNLNFINIVSHNKHFNKKIFISE